MFKKIPYGVKVRVIGNPEDGYRVQDALYCYRYAPFLDNWSEVKNHGVIFPDYEQAVQLANKTYDWWMYYFQKSEAKKKLKKLKKRRMRTGWQRP